jgi:hypothetical protein
MFDRTMMIDHPLKGIKQFKVRFNYGKFLSVIGGHSEVLRVNGDGQTTFEVYMSSDETNYNNLECYVDIERVNILLSDFIKWYGQPIEVNGNPVVY